MEQPDDNGTEIWSLPLILDEAEVWVHLGSRDGPFPALADEVAAGMALAKELCSPRVISRRLAVERVGSKGVSFSDGPSLEGKFLSHLFEGAYEASFLVLTIGPALEERASQILAEGDSIGAIILDAVGSAAAMGLLTQVFNDISKEAAARGWQTGACLSPGLSYWDVTGQATIFQTLSADRIGVQLLESSFLKPQKSHTAVVPLGPEMKVHGDISESFCRYCPATNCLLRREPQVSTTI